MVIEKAAGGVVFRRLDGGVQVVLIKDRYGKWALPKGKLEAGESVEEAGLREIYEETGLQGKIIATLSEVKYVYQDDVRGTVDKQVTYFLVEALDTNLSPVDNEVSQAIWVDLSAAAGRCEYDNNLRILELAAKRLQ